MTTTPTPSPITRVPSWQTCVTDMLARGLAHKQTWPMTFFASTLSMAPTDPLIHTRITKVRQALEKHGFYLSARGQKGQGFILIDQSKLLRKGQAHGRCAKKYATRAYTLLSTMATDKLDVTEAQRHAALTEKAAIRMALVRRPLQISSLLSVYRPKLLSQS